MTFITFTTNHSPFHAYVTIPDGAYVFVWYDSVEWKPKRAVSGTYRVNGTFEPVGIDEYVRIYDTPQYDPPTGIYYRGWSIPKKYITHIQPINGI